MVVFEIDISKQVQITIAQGKNSPMAICKVAVQKLYVFIPISSMIELCLSGGIELLSNLQS